MILGADAADHHQLSCRPTPTGQYGTVHSDVMLVDILPDVTNEVSPGPDEVPPVSVQYGTLVTDATLVWLHVPYRYRYRYHVPVPVPVLCLRTVLVLLVGLPYR